MLLSLQPSSVPSGEPLGYTWAAGVRVEPAVSAPLLDAEEGT